MKTRKPTKEQCRQGFYPLTPSDQQSLFKWGARLHIKMNNSAQISPIHVLPN